ncbi:aquaporin SIP1-1-like [Populus alba x Populus x berolinensis]|nr:aquaporin SIP1-1-like [Populus alba x Populus x berolinensis]
MGAIKGAIVDGILTAMWVFSVPLLGVFSSIVATYVGVEAMSIAGLFITINVAALFMLTFSLIGAAFGGASFNPATTITLYIAGLKPDASLMSMALRFPVQAAGGVGGAMAIRGVMPEHYRHVLKGGPSLRVDLHTGAIAEGVLTFLICLALHFLLLKGPKNVVLKVWLLAVATVGLVMAGGKYTGPSMNPANAYGWAYLGNRHTTWDFFYVYWICPFIGAILAAFVSKFLFKAAPIKEKKA